MPLSLLLQASSISLTPFSLIPQFPALPPFLSLSLPLPLHMLLSLPFFALHSSPSLLSFWFYLTSCIRQGGKAPPDSAASCLFYLPHHPPHHLLQTPSFSLLQQYTQHFSTFTSLIFSLLHPTYPPSSSSQQPYSPSPSLLLSPPSSPLLFIEGCLLMVS